MSISVRGQLLHPMSGHWLQVRLPPGATKNFALGSSDIVFCSQNSTQGLQRYASKVATVYLVWNANYNRNYLLSGNLDLTNNSLKLSLITPFPVPCAAGQHK